MFLLSPSFVEQCGHPRRIRPAFTMLEMLVAVAVIATLAILLLGGVGTLIDRARGATCAANMRQVGSALFAYRSDYNGWFPPGAPKHTMEALNFNNVLVPDYLSELPLCPSAKKTLTPAEKRLHSSSKVWFQRNGGTYAINTVLTQWKLEAMPWPSSWVGAPGSKYSHANMPFVLEVYEGSSSWSFMHQSMALRGNTNSGMAPRSHGKGDSLNWMFVDGHIEMISRNDPRDVPEEQKVWTFPTNPNGRFHNLGINGRHIMHSQFSADKFEELYPDRAK